MRDKEKTVCQQIHCFSASHEDIHKIVDIHLEAFPGFFLSQIGEIFLQRYYKVLVEFEEAHLLVIKFSDSVVGFVGGYESPKRFCAFMVRHWYYFLTPLFVSMIKKPHLIFKISTRCINVFFGNSTQGKAVIPECFWEISTIAVSDKFRGKGLGQTLVRAFTSTAQYGHAKGVTLVTDAEENDKINKFYTELGFVLSQNIGSSRPMNRYTYLFQKE